MSKIKTGLGRGLDALINPSSNFLDNKFYPDPVEENNQHETLLKIPIGNISSNPFQPRVNFDPIEQEELKNSILTNGLIQPITVRGIAKGTYQLISGERRLRACKEIGYKEIPAYILNVETDELMLAMALIENIQRSKLNPIEIGNAYKRLIEECNLTQEEIASKVGKDRSTIANSIRLLKLPLEIQNALISDKITIGHARALINLNDELIQIQIVDKIINENLSVRKVERLVKEVISGSNKKLIKKRLKHGNVKNYDINSIEEKLRNILGTKVICKQNINGSGEIVMEFYSSEELERLIELFESIVS
jgi:ParB family chromosome partitioning protein